MATNFFSRWSKRKLDQSESAQDEHSPETQQVEEQTSDVEQPELISDKAQSNDTRVEDLDSTHVEDAPEAEASLGALLASDTEQHLKKMAMRKLFMSEFNQVDALNDYDHDYSQVKSLSSEIASQLRDWVNQSEEADSKETEEPARDTAQSEHESSSIEPQAEQPSSVEPTTIDEPSAIEQPSLNEQVGQNIPHEK